MTDDPLHTEIERNFDFFQRTLSQHLRAHAGQYALLKSGRVHGYFDTVSAADREGWVSFPDKIYSIQQVTPEPVDLGVYANGAD